MDARGNLFTSLQLLSDLIIRLIHCTVTSALFIVRHNYLQTCVNASALNVWCNSTAPASGFECDPRTYRCEPVASGGSFPSLSGCEAACGITCPDYSQRIGDHCYAVMDKMLKSTGVFNPGTSCAAFPNCTQDCQLDWLQVPPGWQVANSSAEVALAMWSQVPFQPPSAPGQVGYAWGTDYLLYGDGTFSATWNGD